MQWFAHLVIALLVAFPRRVWGVAGGAREALTLCAWGQHQGGHQGRLNFAENLGAETEAVCELPEAQSLQVAGQSCHHA